MEMTEENKAEFQALEKMFESEGWRIFKRDQQAMLDMFRTNGWSNVKDLNGLWYAKGMMDSLHAIINHDKALEAQKELWESNVEKPEPARQSHFHF